VTLQRYFVDDQAKYFYSPDPPLPLSSDANVCAFLLRCGARDITSLVDLAKSLVDDAEAFYTALLGANRRLE
jgi:hypothetical protein